MCTAYHKSIGRMLSYIRSRIVRGLNPTEK